MNIERGEKKFVEKFGMIQNFEMRFQQLTISYEVLHLVESPGLFAFRVRLF